MTKKVQYPFPLMKIAEIVKCMEYMNVSITEQDISKPNPAKIQKVYETMLEIFKGIPRDLFQKPNLDLLDMLEYPDLHNNSLPLISFYKTLQVSYIPFHGWMLNISSLVENLLMIWE